MSEQADVVIIGAGTAGLSALREVQRATRNVLLINDGHWGTTCAAVGCMPSKALIEAANAFQARQKLGAFGVSGAEVLQVDVPAVLNRVRRLRDDFVKGPKAVPGKLGPRAISGRARLDGPGRVVIETGDQAGREISAGAVILAPGSSPVVPKPWQALGDLILTTDHLFELPDLPRRIAVIGMGAIGVELAQALSRLGIEVAGFDAQDRIAGISDPEVDAALQSALSEEFPLHLGRAADLAAEGAAIRVRSGGASFVADAVLAAMGRRPNIENLGLDTLGVTLDDKGVPEVDPNTLQIGDLPVWLAGDGNGHLALLHEAADEGHIAGRNAVADAARAYCRRTELAIVFCDPGVARVGARLSDLDPQATMIGSADFSSQARARTAEKARGVLRIYAQKDTGRLTGAEMCIPGAEHMAHLLALAVERELTVHEMLAMPFYHPVLEEGLRSALRDLAGKVASAGGSDLSDCPALNIAALE